MIYSKKLTARIMSPRNVGSFTEEQAKELGMRLSSGSAGAWTEEGRVCLYWLVDEGDGVIAEAKFQVFGSPFLIGAAEAVCELLLRKNYDQARRIGWELIDKQMRDKNEKVAFPQEASVSLNLALMAIEAAAENCIDIPLAESYVATPLLSEEAGGAHVYPDLALLGHQEKIALIEAVIEKEIRPYVALDEGGVRIVDFVGDRDLKIAYSGSCTTCHSATGATLSAIQQILRARIHPELVVIPDLTL